jgi:carbonic anhydrase/acetyltransferase-like protein (isoleucine patch superfamily)
MTQILMVQDYSEITTLEAAPSEPVTTESLYSVADDMLNSYASTDVVSYDFSNLGGNAIINLSDNAIISDAPAIAWGGFYPEFQLPIDAIIDEVVVVDDGTIVDDVVLVNDCTIVDDVVIDDWVYIDDGAVVEGWPIVMYPIDLVLDDVPDLTGPIWIDPIAIDDGSIGVGDPVAVDEVYYPTDPVDFSLICLVQTDFIA